MKMNIKTRRLIGRRLNRELGKKGINQKELADALNIPSTTVSSFCSGKRTPNTQQIIEISNFLDISADYLLGLYDVPQRDATAEDAFKELERVKANYQKYIAEVKSITEKQNAL